MVLSVVPLPESGQKSGQTFFQKVEFLSQTFCFQLFPSATRITKRPKTHSLRSHLLTPGKPSAAQGLQSGLITWLCMYLPTNTSLHLTAHRGEEFFLTAILSLVSFFDTQRGSNFWSLIWPLCRTWQRKLLEMKAGKKTGERKDSFISARLSAMLRFGRNSSRAVDFGWLSLLTTLLRSQECRSAGENEGPRARLPVCCWLIGNTDLRKRSTCFEGHPSSFYGAVKSLDECCYLALRVT